MEFGPRLLKQLNQTLRAKLAEALPGRPPKLPERGSARRSDEAPSLDEAPEDGHLRQAIRRASAHLGSLQREAGFWEGRVHDNVTITAEYVMFLKFMGLLDPAIAEKAKRTILDGQLENGGWAIYGGGPSNHSATVEAYFALKLCGFSSRHAALKRAKELILLNGGIQSARVFTKIHLALFGEYSWGKIPVINPELMLLPRRAPIHIYEFSSWSRSVIVPLLIIFHAKPVIRLEPEERITELNVPERPWSMRRRIRWVRERPPWDLERIFTVAQTALLIYEKSPVKPLRKQALDMAERWIWEHQDPHGNWGGIFPAMTNSLMALHLRGYPLNDPRIRKGLAMLRSFAEEDSRRFRMQSTVSPVWDTGIAGYAMLEAAVFPTDPRIRRMADWLLRLQILDKRGDWKFKARPHTRPGGWPFEHENDMYPDIDDSALAILALLPLEKVEDLHARVSKSIDRGIEWILGMQGTDGGWGAFDRDNNRKILNQIPFADLKSLLDPGTPDVTGHVLEALGAAGFERNSPSVERGIQFLRRTQEGNGSWFGRWGVDYVYGTGAALSGLKFCGENMKLAYVRKAADWLAGVQQKDGGWGESCSSYVENRYVSLGHSTPSQTAWAMIGMMACPSADEEAIERGARYLLKHQRPDGSWEEPEWTGTGFPKHFFLRYDYYRLYFPLMALGRFAVRSGRKARRKLSASS
jgi:squalene-hopene/tetraprenyl-beta-curcumene cyclase